MRKGMFFVLPVLMMACFHVQADEEADIEQRAILHLLEYKFEPAKITLKAGKPTELTLINKGKLTHEFFTHALKNQAVDVEIHGVLVETQGVQEFEIPPNTKVVLRFTPKKTGEFAMACHMKKPRDHLKAGMSGMLVVE